MALARRRASAGLGVFLKIGLAHARKRKLALRFFSVHISQFGQRIYDRVIQRIGRGVRIVRIGATSRAKRLGFVQFVNVKATFRAGHLGFSPALFWGDPKLPPKALKARRSGFLAGRC
jgi:hypothetical protein